MIPIKTRGAFEFVNIKDIIRCEADEKYTVFFMTNNKTIRSSFGFVHYKPQFEENNFLRVHHSHFVNIIHIKKYNFSKENGSFVIMSNSETVEVSKRKKSDVNKFVKECYQKQ